MSPVTGRSFVALTNVDPGFRTEGFVFMDVSAPFANDRRELEPFVPLYDELIARLRALPGVDAVAGISLHPGAAGGGWDGTPVTQNSPDEFKSAEDLAAAYSDPSRTARGTEYRLASEDYFTAVGIPLLRGRAFDRTRTKAVVLKGDPRMLIARKRVVASDLFMGVAIDCSGSMAGVNLERARRFGVLLAEASRGLRDVDTRFIGFTDRIIFDAGNEDRCAVSQLRSSGGNNDAAALAYIATLARASKRRCKLLIMVSDGLPTECSVVALRKLIEELTRRHGMSCAQVAVAPIVEPCFRHYIEILDQDFDASARRFGRIVTGLARGALAR